MAAITLRVALRDELNPMTRICWHIRVIQGAVNHAQRAARAPDNSLHGVHMDTLRG
jgi:hypothetical protein